MKDWGTFQSHKCGLRLLGDLRGALGAEGQGVGLLHSHERHDLLAKLRTQAFQ